MGWKFILTQSTIFPPTWAPVWWYLSFNLERQQNNGWIHIFSEIIKLVTQEDFSTEEEEFGSWLCTCIDMSNK